MMRNMTGMTARGLALLWLGLLLPLAAGCQEVKPLQQSMLVIETAAGKRIHYAVELAVTPAQQSRGLMHRESMAENRGMLFLYEPQQHVIFWMKNTLLSLDMLFIDGDGRIVNIRERAEPLSTRRLPSEVPVRGVLELNAGQVEKHGIRIGDRVRHPAFEADG